MPFDESIDEKDKQEQLKRRENTPESEALKQLKESAKGGHEHLATDRAVSKTEDAEVAQAMEDALKSGKFNLDQMKFYEREGTMDEAKSGRQRMLSGTLMEGVGLANGYDVRSCHQKMSEEEQAQARNTAGVIGDAALDIAPGTGEYRDFVERCWKGVDPTDGTKLNGSSRLLYGSLAAVSAASYIFPPARAGLGALRTTYKLGKGAMEVGQIVNAGRKAETVISTGARVAKGAEKASDMADAAKAAEKAHGVIEAGKTVEKVEETAKVAKKIDQATETVTEAAKPASRTEALKQLLDNPAGKINEWANRLEQSGHDKMANMFKKTGTFAEKHQGSIDKARELVNKKTKKFGRGEAIDQARDSVKEKLKPEWEKMKKEVLKKFGLDRLNIFGGLMDKLMKKVIGSAVDFIPGVGKLNMLAKGVTGKDWITGDKVSNRDKMMYSMVGGSAFLKPFLPKKLRGMVDKAGKVALVGSLGYSAYESWPLVKGAYETMQAMQGFFDQGGDKSAAGLIKYSMDVMEKNPHLAGQIENYLTENIKGLDPKNLAEAIKDPAIAQEVEKHVQGMLKAKEQQSKEKME